MEKFNEQEHRKIEELIEHWRSKLTIQEEKDQYLKNKEIELQNVKKNMEQINDQEHRKIEELMAIIDKKGKEIQEKDE